MTAAICLRSVSKVYRSALETKVGLHELTLAVTPGRFVALIGPNGAGKTSAIKLMATLTRPTTGEVRIFGHDATRTSATVRKEIGYVGQETSTDMYATAEQNMLHHCAMYGMTRHAARKPAAQLLSAFGLQPQAGMEVRRLSGGQRRRLDIAMALVHKPRLLILDEPTSNLDPDARRRVWETLSQLRAKDEMTILFSTHYLNEADDYADDVVLIDKGRCVATGRPDELKADLGGDSLVLTFRDGEQAVRALRHLRQDGACEGAQVAAERIVSPGTGAEHIHAVLDRLARRGLSPACVTLSRPSLDDVYIRLTGASFEQTDIEGQQARIEQQSARWFA